MIKQITFGTRGSPLAIIQTNKVISQLKKIYPDIKCISKIIETYGDKDQKSSLTLTEHLGIFATEIQSSLINKEIDAAVHSLKDLPINHLKKLKIAAIPDREDPTDILYHPDGLSLYDLPSGSIVGTCSLRRTGQLRNLRKDIIIKDIRGNVETRMEKVHSGQYDAIVLAAAGLIRLKYDISKYYKFSFDEILPAPGQGALAVEIRKGNKELESILAKIDNIKIRESVEVEREILNNIGEGCSIPIGTITLSKVDSLDTMACIVDPKTGKKTLIKETNWKGVGKELAKTISKKLLSNGGKKIILKYN